MPYLRDSVSSVDSAGESKRWNSSQKTLNWRRSDGASSSRESAAFKISRMIQGAEQIRHRGRRGGLGPGE